MKKKQYLCRKFAEEAEKPMKSRQEMNYKKRMKAIKCLFISVLATLFISCGDTNYCYVVEEHYPIYGTTVTRQTEIWATANELDAIIAEMKAALETAGVPSDLIEITYKKNRHSQEDCWTTKPSE